MFVLVYEEWIEGPDNRGEYETKTETADTEADLIRAAESMARLNGAERARWEARDPRYRGVTPHPETKDFAIYQMRPTWVESLAEAVKSAEQAGYEKAREKLAQDAKEKQTQTEQNDRALYERLKARFEGES